MERLMDAKIIMKVHLQQVSEYIPSGCSLSTISLYRSIGNKRNVYRGKDCMKKFCEFLRMHAMKIINFKKKKMKLLVKEQQDHMKMQKSVIFLKKDLKINI